MVNIVHKELSYELIGIFYTVHNRLGRFCTHKQCCDAIEILFKKEGIKYQREIAIPIDFMGQDIQGNQIDFFVKGIIPVDVKVKKYITKADYIQMKRYLKATDCQLGIVVNFREQTLKPKRVLNSQGKL